MPRYSKENFPNILKLAKGLEKIGERHGATAGQVALAWLLAQGDDVIPIPGTRKQKVTEGAIAFPSFYGFRHSPSIVQYLEENLGALKLKLTPEELAEVREIAKKADATNGPRYPAGLAETLFAETPAWK